MKPFDVRLIERRGHRFVEAVGEKALIEDEKDILDLISMCAAFKADRLMVRGEVLSMKFFDLKTGQARMILQKLVNYRIRTAAVLSRDRIQGKFGEFVAETNHGPHFRVFYDRQQAEFWLLRD
jgi:hypothetical protein